MRLLVLMYHRARSGRHGNSPEVLDAHFAHIASRYANVLPGEAGATDRLNICLTFDDGYFDFYARVFPLLQRHNLRALLAIPPMYVAERTTATADARLRVEIDEAFADPPRGGFCTWPELEEMVQSGSVAIAAHGFSHCRLDALDADLALEIDSSQTTLTSRLARPVTSFVFPFGRYGRESLGRAKLRYRYVFRIGGAMNRNWNSRMLYRVDADQMADFSSLLAPSRLIGYRARYFWNRWRRR
jgi:peptidoglycan/xylan/chitin deacetylase (PgdA/CDA1 family)